MPILFYVNEKLKDLVLKKTSSRIVLYIFLSFRSIPDRALSKFGTKQAQNTKQTTINKTIIWVS